MNQRKLTSVLLKVLAIVCLILAVNTVAQYLPFLLQNVLASGIDYLDWTILTIWILPIVQVAIAFILLRYADRIAAKLNPTDSTALPDVGEPTDAWYMFAATIAGIILVVWYVPITLAMCLSNFVLAPSDNSEFAREIRTSTWLRLLKVVMQLALGVYLIVGARTIVALVRKLRRD